MICAASRCAGWDASSASFRCGGVDNMLRWNLPLGTADYTLTTKLLMENANQTAAALSLYSATNLRVPCTPPCDLYGAMDRAGLDGGQAPGENFFFWEGEHWGGCNTVCCDPSCPAHISNTQTPAANTWFTFTISRTAGVTSAVLNGGTPVFTTPASMPNFAITAVGVRPRRSMLRLQRYTVCQQSLPPPAPPAPVRDPCQYLDGSWSCGTYGPVGQLRLCTIISSNNGSDFKVTIDPPELWKTVGSMRVSNRATYGLRCAFSIDVIAEIMLVLVT